ERSVVLPDEIAHALSGHQVHQDVKGVVVLDVIENVDDVGVAQAGLSSRFALEPGDKSRVAGEPGRKGLERGGVANLAVVHLVDSAHPAFADHAIHDPVADDGSFADYRVIVRERMVGYRSIRDRFRTWSSGYRIRP